jgi:uncharacterized protein YceK
MTMRNSILTLAALALLSGCGSKEDVSLKNASPEDVAKAGSGATQLKPGQWDTVIKIVAVELPGAAGASATVSKAMIAKMIGREQKSSQCISPEQAAKPPAELLAGANSGSNCKFDSFELQRGTLSSKLTCGKLGEAGAMVMTSKGPYGGDNYALDTDMTLSSPAGEMKIKALNSAKRVGDCPVKDGA